jgi:hypothetical protein
VGTFAGITAVFQLLFASVVPPGFHDVAPYSTHASRSSIEARAWSSCSQLALLADFRRNPPTGAPSVDRSPELWSSVEHSRATIAACDYLRPTDLGGSVTFAEQPVDVIVS